MRELDILTFFIIKDILGYGYQSCLSQIQAVQYWQEFMISL